MNIEAVTVCVNYDDFLRETIPYNMTHFSRWVIVTRPSDEKTRELCRKYSLDCILTDDNGKDEFSKGRLIERGLQHLSAKGWRLHLDADIVIPSRFQQLLESANLYEDTLYGCDRLMVKSWEEWQKLKQNGFLTNNHQYNYINMPSGFTIGTRWGTFNTGYCPIGFFQLWNSSTDEWRGSRIKPYPTEHNTACRTDVQHALKWDRNKRALIPEIIVAHLESEQGTMGINWKGRKSKPFGPQQPFIAETKSFKEDTYV